MTTTRAPVPNPVPSFWTSEPLPYEDLRSTENLPSEADIVIIGAGFAGVATAYHILTARSESPAPSILLLDARKICSGATCRNGGHVKPDLYFNVSKYISMFGAGAAAEVAAFEAANVLAVKELVETEELDCDFHLTRAVDVYLDAQHAKETEAAWRKLRQEDEVNLKDVSFIPQKHAERVSGVKGARCAFSFTAAHLWPAKMVHQLLGKLLEQGQSLNVQANTPVASVSGSKDVAGKWTIQTPRGVVRASKIVYATNGYTSQVLPEYAQSITPIRGVCSHISIPQGKNAPHLVNTYAIRFDSRNYDYLIPRPDGSIVVGGARQRFWHNPERWFSTVRDDEQVDEAVSYFDGYMQRHFRGWEDTGAETTKVWTGIMGYSADFMPHIGHVPSKPGQFVIAGFNGHGMPQILLSSKGLAAMVRDDVPFEETGIPRLFKTTKDRIERRDSPLEDSFRPLWEAHAKARL
ncbi:FAD dependent oxidoreductase [Paraphoma chrysanthemicola]|nr:FAD dependent oxidoreductase [Paraphoma chrysanthemicola]